MLNIKTRAVRPTLTFQLSDETDAPLFNDDGTPCMATVHGPGSKRHAQATARRQNRLMAKAQRGQAASETAEERQRNQAEFLADITEDLGVEYPGPDGQPLEGRAKLLAIYSDIEIGYIADQVAKKAGDWANFSKGSATS